MGRLLRIVILLTLIFSAKSAFAAGGACPSGANYRNPANPTASFVTLSSLGVTSCYYIAANGVDTATGTDETHPWAHAPKMPACSNNCAALQSSGAPAGTGFIFRGGDTWHFGNSGASPYTGGTWDFNNSSYGANVSGTSSSPIYIGVDPTWYTGDAWVRPIFTGDNPLCNSGNLSATCLSGTIGNNTAQYYVTSCLYQIAVGGNNFISLGARKYYIFDSLEMTGSCANTPGQPAHTNNYFDMPSLNGPMTFMNNYLHGWSHVRYAGQNGSGSCTSGVVCIATYMFDGSSIVSGPGENIIFNVIDGSDSDPAGGEFAFSAGYNVAYNVIRYTSQWITTDMHTIHDNLYEYWFENGHSNLMESNTEDDQTGINTMYNNVFRHLQDSPPPTNTGVGILLSPSNGTTDYMFNNVVYYVGPVGELINLSQSEFSDPKGQMTVFNNTYDFTTSSPTVSCYQASGTFTLTNSFYVSDHGVYNGNSGFNCSSYASGTELVLTHAAASAKSSPQFSQYSSSQTYAFSPTASTNPTVNAGANVQSFCNAMLANSDSFNHLAGTACQKDTTFGVSYNASNHTVTYPARAVVARPTSGAWDVGAYQFSATSAQGPQAPTNLQAQVQ